MISYETLRYLPKLTPLLLILSITIGLSRYRTLDIFHKHLFIYLIMMFIIDVLGRALKFIYGTNQVVLLIYSLTEICFFLLFYKKHLLKKKNLALTILGIFGIIYIVGEIVYYFILNDVNAIDFQPYSKVVDNAVIILLALTFLQEKMSDFRESKWENFRLNLVILVFFTLNTLIFLPFNFLVNESSGVKFYFWTGNVIVTLFFYTFIINEIWRNAKSKTIK